MISVQDTSLIFVLLATLTHVRTTLHNHLKSTERKLNAIYKESNILTMMDTITGPFKIHIRPTLFVEVFQHLKNKELHFYVEPERSEMLLFIKI